MQFKGTMKNRGMVNVNVSYKNQQSIVYARKNRNMCTCDAEKDYDFEEELKWHLD